MINLISLTKRFSSVFRGYKTEALARNGLRHSCIKSHKTPCLSVLVYDQIKHVSFAKITLSYFYMSMQVEKVINKAFIRYVTRDYFFIELLFVLIGISFLSMYRGVLKGTHGGRFKLTNPKHEHRTKR